MTLKLILRNLLNLQIARKGDVYSVGWSSIEVPSREIVRLIQALVPDKQSGTHFVFFNDIETLSLWRRTITCTHPCAKTLCDIQYLQCMVGHELQGGLVLAEKILLNIEKGKLN